jgi:hypothetical protein
MRGCRYDTRELWVVFVSENTEKGEVRLTFLLCMRQLRSDYISFLIFVRERERGETHLMNLEC